MLKNFMNVAIRSFQKNLFTTSINILGLSLGFCSFLILSLFVINELSYDTWHKNSANTFRLTTIDEALGVSSNEVAITNPRMPQSAQEELSNVIMSSRMMQAGEIRLEKGDEAFYTEHAKYVEKDFFKIFDIKDIDSSFLNEFHQPYKMVLSESMAEKIYKDKKDIHGEILKIDQDNYEVIGTFPDLEKKSHLKFDALMCLTPNESDSNFAQYLDSWGGLGMIGYVVLDDPSKEKEVESQLKELATKYDVPEFWIPQLQPLEEIHLKSKNIIFDNYQVDKGDETYVYALALVAIFVLIIAAFNFMNLSTAQSGSRAKEVGVRKVLGSGKFALIRQFLVESTLLSLVSLIIGFLMFAISGDLFQLGQNINMNQVLFANLWLIPFYLLISIVIGILAGFYPAFVLSNFNPINMLRGKFQSGSRGVLLRKSLVTIQFVAAVSMIITTLMVSRQISFLKSKDLGFNKEQLINIPIGDPSLRQKITAFKEKCDKLSFVKNATYSSNMPGRGTGRTGVNLDSSSTSDEETWIVSVMSMDENYLETMGIKIAEGRNYDPSFGTDQQNAVIINQAMKDALGWENALEKELSTGNTQRKIIAVVENFHFAGMRHKIEPLMLYFNPDPTSNLSLKLEDSNTKENVEELQALWSETLSEYPFDYQFFDEEFDQLFKADEQFSSLISKFTWLSIILSCLGLFGLSYFTTEQRRKEIGVRKVLGSSTLQIILLLIREFVFLIAAGSLIAWPISYFVLDDWLSDFQYRIEIMSIGNSWVFIFATVITMTIALIAIGYKSTRAALANPVHSLRDE